MARKPISTPVVAIGANAAAPQFAPKISLTLAQTETGELAVTVAVTEFITYSQELGFTRLNLTGGKVLKVRETTDQIDRLVRCASAQN